MASHGSLGDIMHHEEIRQMISQLVPIDVRDYASPTWFKQDERLQKLNMQIHVNAIMKNDEYMLEEMITQDKYKMLILDLLITAAWKRNVLPLIKSQVSSFNSLKVYLAIYHEAVVCNMLEVMLYHYTAVQESKELLIEIIDYCYKKITPQIAKAVRRRVSARTEKKSEEEIKKEKMESILKRSPVDELDQQVE